MMKKIPKPMRISLFHQKHAKIEKDFPFFTKKAQKPIKIPFFSSKKLKNRSDFHFFGQKTLKITQAWTKMLKSPLHFIKLGPKPQKHSNFFFCSAELAQKSSVFLLAFLPFSATMRSNQFLLLASDDQCSIQFSFFMEKIATL